MIDWKRVEELKEEIGTDGFVEVVDMFLDEAEGAVRALVAGPPAEAVPESQPATVPPASDRPIWQQWLDLIMQGNAR